MSWIDEQQGSSDWSGLRLSDGLVSREATLDAAEDMRLHALLTADADSLDRLLADDFVYVHSSGRVEQRKSYVESLRSGAALYHAIDVLERTSWVDGHSGTIRARMNFRLSLNGVPRLMELMTLSDWHRSRQGWRLRAWASVAITTPSSRPVSARPDVEDSVRAALSQISTPTISNLLLSRGLRHTMLRDVHPVSTDQPRLVGPAYTLRFIPSRDDLDTMDAYASRENKHRRAIEECPEGAVLVIDASGNTGVSSMGDLMARRLKARGVAGVVTDGGFRDTAGVVDSGLPCFQRRGASPATPIELHAADLDVPVGCGGIAIYPGDVVVGDADGVVVIPRELARWVSEAGLEATRYEAFAESEISRGASIYDVLPATPESRQRFQEWVAAGHLEGSLDGSE